jgi:predicted HicB family RNase H-like nuclease
MDSNDQQKYTDGQAKRPLHRKSEHIAFRVPKHVKGASINAAAADSRTLASLMEKILTDYLKDGGYLK